jgi:K+-sensing histidine kinase KdpD
MVNPGTGSLPPDSPGGSRDRSLAGLAPPGEATALVRYGLAVGLVVLAFLLRLALYGELSNRLPFSFFLPAAMIAAWYGGMGPGFLAAASGLLLGDYFFLPPHRSFGPISDADRVAITVFAITSTLAILLLDNLHGRIRKLKRELEESERESPLPR